MKFAMILPGFTVLANDRATLETLVQHMATAARVCSEAATRE